MNKKSKIGTYIILLLSFLICISGFKPKPQEDKLSKLRAGFLQPPNSAKPGVYWYFMDGNLSKESMTADLESMKKAGIGNLVFLEVNVGIPRGPVDFLSDKWQDMFAHAVHEAERLDIEITLGIGPGWTGSGGPWVKPAQSMQHLVSSSTTVEGGKTKKIHLPLPAPKPPYFGEGAFTLELKKEWDAYYEDVAVLAFPAPTTESKITDIDEKALYYRAPYTSVVGVKPYLLPSANTALSKENFIKKQKVVDLTAKLQPDGTLDWEVPSGKWTIMRFGSRNNGAITRPAPEPGLGFEADKFDTVALNAHLENYIGKLLKKIGGSKPNLEGGLKRLHMDSWEMGSQNWTQKFRSEFTKRRGYDPLPFYPVYAGNVVESVEISERFLWDLRQTSQELLLENHAQHVKTYGKRNGLTLSIEPYDMNPTADLEFGAIADVPMAEFWSKGFGFLSSFSCIEAVSIGHVNGVPLIPAEAFTAQNERNNIEGWNQYPGRMKNQGDWALAAGINRFVFHTFQNQYLADSLRPGMTMGPYGVHWDRSQTWWPMANGYHQYLSRCQFLLQQGNTVADILYLTPEGSPHVFRAPASAFIGDDTIPDRKEFNFDGCAPGQLYKAKVENGRIVFPGGASYRILVLPSSKTITPALLNKIGSLINDGATVVGSPPEKAPGLSNYPNCDKEVETMVAKIWGATSVALNLSTGSYGKGKIIWGEDLNKISDNLYPMYDLTAKILKDLGAQEDFRSSGPIRYTHRASADWDMYFISNRTDNLLQTNAVFRSTKGAPQLWDPLTGEIRPLPEYSVNNSLTTIPVVLTPNQSYFIVFAEGTALASENKINFPKYQNISTLSGSWNVSFDPKWGGPAQTKFEELKDWTLMKEDGIKYYSGIAVYRKQFDLPAGRNNTDKLILDLGDVKNMARVKLNGKELGILWTAPWKIDISSAVLEKNNVLEIEVANLWPNRLIGDAKLPDDGIKNNKWPEWLVKGLPRPTTRYTFTTYQHYTADAPLVRSGLLGPVTITKSTYDK